MRDELREALGRLPDRPGVYLFRDASGRVIYVGKAVSLRSRVGSYFHAPHSLPVKTQHLVREIADLEFIVAGSEVEALILEQNLIKEHRPKYNVLLKDDKHYPYLKITDEPYPRLVVARRMKKDGGTYFGPYPSAGAMNETLRLMRRLFPLRTCSPQKFRTVTRPCLLYHIKRCVAPCMPGWVTPEAYQEIVRQATLFLEGKLDDALEALRARMQEAAERLEFEAAAQIRDRIRAVERITAQHQTVALGKEVDQDVIGLAREGAAAAAQVFLVRQGKLVGREHVPLVGSEGLEESEVVSALLKQYYLRAAHVPAEILVPALPEDASSIAAWLETRRGGKVALRVPRRGPGRELLRLATENARLALGEEAAPQAGAAPAAGVAELAQALGLSAAPERIECFDVSTLQGEATVAAMVVFRGGRPYPAHYRRFRIRSLSGQDDLAALQEALRRRLRRAEDPEAGEGFRELPDLLLIDGGAPQLGAARQVLEELGQADLPVFALAKGEEVVYAPGRETPIALPQGSPALRLLQQVRDEAHRFAITYHRQLKRRNVRASLLDEVEGIGPRRKRELLRRFGSVEGLRQASVADIVAAGIPRAVAERLKQVLTP